MKFYLTKEEKQEANKRWEIKRLEWERQKEMERLRENTFKGISQFEKNGKMDKELIERIHEHFRKGLQLNQKINEKENNEIQQ